MPNCGCWAESHDALVQKMKIMMRVFSSHVRPLSWRSVSLSVVHFFVCGLFVLLCSCGDSEFEFTRHKAFFVFDNGVHLEPALASAMNPFSSGIFCHITLEDATHFSFHNNQGQTGRQNATALELQRTILLGVYNQSGVIVGYGALSDPAQFYAYDAQCPNCYAKSSLPRYVLSMTQTGLARCSECGRSYDLNNHGVVVEGENGSKLMRYRAQTTGPNGVLSINN